MENEGKYEIEAKKKSVQELKRVLLNRQLYNGWQITYARKELEARNIDRSRGYVSVRCLAKQ